MSNIFSILWISYSVCSNISWLKKIRDSNITQCVQQAAGLVTKITDEVEKQLMGAFIRINRTVPLYLGTDAQGIPMANWSLDGIVELIQQYYHKSRFKNDGGWSIHSPYIVMTSKSPRLLKQNKTELMIRLHSKQTQL